MKNRLLITLLVLGTLASAAPASDSLIRFSDLHLSHDAEKKAFAALNANGNDYIDLFLASYSNTAVFSSGAARQKIGECVAHLKQKTAKMSQPKTVKYIYKYIHDRFFKVYRFNNSFADIFTKGEYNCVSGSALYAMVFGEMDIPYQIIEAPQHVFLFAYPSSHKIMIETTSARNGYKAFNDEYIKRFVKYLAESKLISDNELAANSASELFNKYYFAQQGIDLRALAGIQYGNYSVYYSEAHEGASALNEARKYYYISPTPRARYMLRNALYEVISNNSYSSPKDLDNLSLLCRFNNSDNKETSNETLRQEFLRLTEQQLIRNSDFQNYGRSFEVVVSAIADTSLKKELAFIYNYEMARIISQESADNEVILNHLAAAYTINPRHAELRSMIRIFLFQIISNSTAAALIREMDSYSTTFDFINTDEKFNTIRANVLLEMAYQAYTLNNIGTGDAEIGKFEKLCESNSGLRPSEHYVEKAYSVAAAAYFRRGNKTKTKELLQTGIKYAPGSFGLQNRLRQLH